MKSCKFALVAMFALGLLPMTAASPAIAQEQAGAEANAVAPRSGIGTRGYTYADLIEASETDIDFSQIEIGTRVIVIGTADLADAGDITAETYLAGDFERPLHLLARAGANEKITLAIELQGFSYAEHDIAALKWENGDTLIVFVNTLD